MKQALFLCLVLSLVGTLLRLLTESAGARAAAKAVAALCSALMLLVLCTAVRGGTQPLPTFDFPDESAYFQSLSADTLDAVCREAEKQLAARMRDGIADAVGKTPTACRVTIARADLRVSAVEVVFDRRALLSSYAVKQYVRTECGADTAVEVVFE